MKKFILPAIMGALFIIGLTTTVSSSEPPANSSVCKICPLFVELGFFETMGVCMSACNTCVNSGQGEVKSAICFCKQIPIGENFGQCINLIRGE